MVYWFLIFRDLKVMGEKKEKRSAIYYLQDL